MGSRQQYILLPHVSFKWSLVNCQLSIVITTKLIIIIIKRESKTDSLPLRPRIGILFVCRGFISSSGALCLASCLSTRRQVEWKERKEGVLAVTGRSTPADTFGGVCIEHETSCLSSRRSSICTVWHYSGSSQTRGSQIRKDQLIYKQDSGEPNRPLTFALFATHHLTTYLHTIIISHFIFCLFLSLQLSISQKGTTTSSATWFS